MRVNGAGRPKRTPGRDHDHAEQGLPVALVAGASRGLGLLIARELGTRGHRVVICARNEAELSRAVTFLSTAGVEATARVCDVRDRDAVESLLSYIEDSVGPIHTLVTVAGIIGVGPLQSMTEDNFRDAVDTMLWGPVNLALAVLPQMRGRRSGHIGTVTSIGGMVSVPHLVPYSTAKFGAVGFSQGLAAELAGTGVTATTIVPGLMRTGSHLRAQFGGRQTAEFAWFAASASLPVLSMDPERAAAVMVDAVLTGKPTVLVGWLAKVGARVHGLAPSTTVRVMRVAQRLLPRPPRDGSAGDLVEGRVAEQRLSSTLLGTVTALGRKSARRFNETDSDNHARQPTSKERR